MGKRSDEKPVKLWTLDTETRGLFGKIFRCGAYDGNEYIVGDTFEEVTQQMLKYTDFEHHVYIHNLDFDLSKAAPELFQNDAINFTESIFINGNVITITTRRMVLHDSYHLLTSSLDALCKSFGIKHKKMNLDAELHRLGYADKEEYFSNIPADDAVLNEYLKLDCIALYELLQELMKLAEVTPEEVVKCPTTPSLAMLVYKRNFPDDYEKATSTNYNGEWGQFLENYVRFGYYGGRTEVFTPYIMNGWHYDLNSLYPAAMKKAYPIGRPIYCEDYEAAQKYGYFKRRGRGAGFLRCDIEVPKMFIPPLPSRGMGKLLFPIGKLSGVWTFEEVKKAEELGCKIHHIYSCVFFRETAYIFKDYVAKFEELKTHSTGALREFAKMMLNTLYGKFGMKRERSTFIDIADLTEEELEELPILRHRYNKHLTDIEFAETTVTSKAAYIQPHIAAYVTSYARLILLDGLLAQDAKGTVAYCDTDSIAATVKMPDALVDPVEFGKYKLESEIVEGIFLQPKLYAEKHRDGKVTIKAKGVPREIRDQKMSWEYYEMLLRTMQEGTVDYIEIFNNYKARKKFMTMLKENEDLDTPRYLKKGINLLSTQKRIMDYDNNTSYPHVIPEYGALFESTIKIDKERIAELCENYDDIDIIEEAINQFGKIQFIAHDSIYYLLYTTIEKKDIQKYFSSDGIPIEEWCRKSGWNPADFLYEMGAIR